METLRETLPTRLTALVLLAVLAQPGASSRAWADGDTGPVPKGTRIERPDGSAFVLEAPRWLVTRTQLDQANATSELSERLTTDLMACSGALVAARQPEPGWQIATRWAVIGAAIAGSFFAGLWAGSR